MSDSNLHEYGNFISADGLKLSAPWRLAAYGPTGPLTDEQVADLASRFGLDPADLRELSSSLGEALNFRFTSNLAQVSQTKAAAEGVRRLRKTNVEVAAVRKRLADSVGMLAGLHFEDPDGEHARLLERTRAALISSLHLLQEVPPSLELLMLEPGTALVLDPIDKRQLQDERRRAVLRAIFGLWHRAGRSLTCTSDPVTSERRGPLIDFTNAVVACVTDPPSALSGETIFKDLMSQRDVVQAAEQFVRELKNRDQDT